jgi:hypothetical protein
MNNIPSTLEATLHSVIEPNPEDHEEVRIHDETVSTTKAVLGALQLDNTPNGSLLGNTQVTLLKTIPTGAVSIDFSNNDGTLATIDIDGEKVTVNGVETGITDVRSQITALGISLQ